MPINRERERDNSKNSGSVDIFYPLPNKAGEKISNDVIIPLFHVSTWKMFNPDQEAVDKYGLIGPGLISVPEDLYSFYMKIPVHGINDYARYDGTSGFTYVICPNQMNKYLVEILGYNQMFERPKCAFCEREQEWWDKVNERWEQLGYSEDDRKRLTTENYRSMIQNDNVLRNARDTARKYKTMDRYVMPIFDHAKAIGSRPLDEGEEFVHHQVFMAPKTIYEKLSDLYMDHSVEFFNTTGPEVPVVSIIKDTRECYGNNLLQTKYDVMTGKSHTYQEEWLEYINNTDMMVDPSRFIHMASYNDMMYHLSSNTKEDKSTTTHSVLVPPRGPMPQVPPRGPMPQTQMQQQDDVQDEGSEQQDDESVESQQGNIPTPPRGPMPPQAPKSGGPVPPKNMRSGPPIPLQASSQGMPSQSRIVPPINPGSNRQPPPGSGPPRGKRSW